MFRSCFLLNIHHFHSQRLVGFVVGIGAYWLAMSSAFTQTHTHTQRLSVILSKCIISVVVVILYIIRKIYFNWFLYASAERFCWTVVQTYTHAAIHHPQHKCFPPLCPYYVCFVFLPRCASAVFSKLLGFTVGAFVSSKQHSFRFIIGNVLIVCRLFTLLYRLEGFLAVLNSFAFRSFNS